MVGWVGGWVGGWVSISPLINHSPPPSPPSKDKSPAAPHHPHLLRRQAVALQARLLHGPMEQHVAVVAENRRLRVVDLRQGQGQGQGQGQVFAPKKGHGLSSSHRGAGAAVRFLVKVRYAEIQRMFLMIWGLVFEKSKRGGASQLADDILWNTRSLPCWRFFEAYRPYLERLSSCVLVLDGPLGVGSAGLRAHRCVCQCVCMSARAHGCVCAGAFLEFLLVFRRRTERRGLAHAARKQRGERVPTRRAEGISALPLPSTHTKANREEKACPRGAQRVYQPCPSPTHTHVPPGASPLTALPLPSTHTRPTWCKPSDSPAPPQQTHTSHLVKAL